MTYNTPKFDEDAHIKSMSDTQLMDAIVQMNDAIAKMINAGGNPKIFVDYIAKLRMERADRIGRINRK